MLREETINSEWQLEAPFVKQLRRLPVGAEPFPGGGVHFRVWASQRQRVDVVLEAGPGQSPEAEPQVAALTPEASGYFSGLMADAGGRYVLPLPARWRGRVISGSGIAFSAPWAAWPFTGDRSRQL
jgi:hypothetical protein